MLQIVYNLTLLFFAALSLADPPAAAPRQLIHSYTYQGGEIPVAFFDADSTLRVSSGEYFAPMDASEVVILPGVAEKIEELTKQGYFVVIVSNQIGSAQRTTPEHINEAMMATVHGAEARGGVINYFDYSTVEADSKPHTTMADALEKKLQASFGEQAKIDRSRSFMVGDAAYRKPDVTYAGDLRPDGRMGFDFENFDRKFAENNHILFREPQDFFGWNKLGVDRFSRPAEIDAYLEKARLGLSKVRACMAAFQGLALP